MADWNILPELCLRCICKFSHSKETFNNIRLTCKHFYMCLPINKEILQKKSWRHWMTCLVRMFGISHELFLLNYNDISINTTIWFIRLFGITKTDVRNLNLISSYKILKFYYDLYGNEDDFLFSSKLNHMPKVPRSLDAMKLLLEEIKIQNIVSPYSFFNNCWILNSACWSGDIECIKYVTDKLDIKFINDDVTRYACGSGNISVVEWLQDTFHFADEAITKSNAIELVIKNGDIDMFHHIRNKYNAEFMFGFSSDYYGKCLIYAAESNNMEMFKLIETIYEDNDEIHIDKIDLLNSIFEEGRGSDEEKKVMLDYVYEKYGIKKYIHPAITKLIQRGYNKSFHALINKIKSVSDHM